MPEPASLARFERLTMPFFPDVTRFARSLARDSAQADDLVQETYLRALRGWSTFREGSDPRRWLFTVCHNAFVRMVQRERRYVASLDCDAEMESLHTAVAHGDAERSGVADLVERMELSEAIARALTAIPPNFRSVVALVDVNGLSYEEAALVLDVPIGTVRSRLFRGRRLLQDMLLVFARDAGFESARRFVPPAPVQLDGICA